MFLFTVISAATNAFSANFPVKPFDLRTLNFEYFAFEVFAQSVTESLKDAQELIPLTFEFWAATGSSKYRKEMKALFKDFYKKIGDVLVAVIEDGIERGEFNADLDTASYVPAIVGAVDVMGLQAWFDDEFDIEKVMNGFFQLIIKALEKQKEESCIDI